jgi:colicin import membrane protein
MIAPQRFQHLSSGGLALLVHGLLLLGLMVGVSWKNPPHLPIEADIWTELPAPPQPAPAEFAPLPELLPEALPALPPEPVPPVAAEVEAQIALEKIEKKRLEEIRRAEAREAALQQKLEKQQAEANRLEALRLAELQKVEKERLEKVQIEKEKRDLKRRQLDQDMARQMQEELAAETSQLNALQAALQKRERATNQSRVVRDFQDRIRAKVKDALILPQNLKGDAEVEYQVSLLPNGEVLRVKLIKTSGQPLYDLAVERAIFKASPLPLPSDRTAAQPFREGLTMKFRPSDDAGVVP